MKNLLPILSAIILLTILWLCANNLQTTHACLIGSQINTPLASLIFISFALGAISVGLVACFKTSGTNKENKKLQEWSAQDAKLASQIKSDREKQLEAKITTLESALKTALKKNS